MVKNRRVAGGYISNFDGFSENVYDRVKKARRALIRKDAETEHKEKDPYDNIWDSGLEILKPVIEIPHKLLIVCNTIHDKVDEIEFSILVKGKWDSNCFRLEDAYLIPKQKVTRYSVDYLEDLGAYKRDGFNTIIHSHPFKSAHFSGADDEYINSNFICSILFSDGEFTASIINVDIEKGKKLQISPQMSMILDSCEIAGLDNIIEERFAKNYSNYNCMGKGVYRGAFKYNEDGQWGYDGDDVLAKLDKLSKCDKSSREDEEDGEDESLGDESEESRELEEDECNPLVGYDPSLGGYLDHSEGIEQDKGRKGRVITPLKGG